MAQLLDADEVTAVIAAHPRWELQDGALVRTHGFPSFPDAVAAVAEVAAIAEGMDHHPDMDIRWRNVTFRCATHSAGGITDLDATLVGAIDGVIDAGE